MSKPLVVFDIEATCDIKLPKNKREIIEIGALKIVNGIIVDKFSKLIKPKRNPKLSTYCKELTHISQEDIDLASNPKEVLLDFIEWAQDAILAAWGDFDEDIVKRELHKNKIEFDLYFINLKKVYLSVKKFPSTYSLQDSLRKEKLAFDGTQHRAYDDAYNTYLIYQKNKQQMDDMIKKIYSNSHAFA